MKNRIWTGKWSKELKQLSTVVDTLENFVFTLSKTQGQNPAAKIKKIEDTLNQISAALKNNLHKSFYDFRIAELTYLLIKCESQLVTIKEKNAQAVRIARKLVSDHTVALKQIMKSALPKGQISTHWREDDDLVSSDKTLSFFGRSIDRQHNTWEKIRSQLDTFSSQYHLDHLQHNMLACILMPNDQEFIQALDKGRMTIGAEIAYIAIQRLKEIASKATNAHLKNIARNQIEHFISSTCPDSLIRCNELALECEITKIALHALLYPDKKVVWLGTARAVEAAMKEWPGDAMYLNPEDDKWSWELNRSWLQAAVYLKYEFKLIEQHFPGIENAMLSGDVSKFIAQLINEIRPEGNGKTSQYNGNDSPTATPQEVLALLDFGCVAHKNEDNSISFLPSGMREMSYSTCQRNDSVLLPRSHSCPNFFKNSSPPPFLSRQDHFISPEAAVQPTAIFSMAHKV